MQAEDALISLSQVAAAFAGFSGIVAALGARSVGEWSPAARFRFANLLVISVAAALFAFVPVVLGGSPLETAMVWALSSAMLGLFSFIYLLAGRRRLNRLRVRPDVVLRRWMAIFTMTALAGISICQWLNVLGWPFGSSELPFVAGIFVLLVISGLQFILLALDSSPRQPRDEG